MASWDSKHNFSIIILLAVLFGACSEKEQVPDHIIPQSQMTNMMIQIHLLEAKIKRLGISQDSAKVVYNHFESILLKDAGLDSLTYFSSYDYYSDHPKLFAQVYTAVTDSLMEMESKEKLKFESIRKNKKKMDSLKLNTDTTKVNPKPLNLRKNKNPRKNVNSKKRRNKNKIEN